MKGVRSKHRVSKAIKDNSCQSLRRSNRIKSTLPSIIRDSEESESENSAIGDPQEPSLSCKSIIRSKSKPILDISSKDADKDSFSAPDKLHSKFDDVPRSSRTDALRSRKVKNASSKRKSNTNIEDDIFQRKTPDISPKYHSHLSAAPAYKSSIGKSDDEMIHQKPRLIASCPDSEDESASCDELLRDPCRSPIKKKFKAEVAVQSPSIANFNSGGKGKQKAVTLPPPKITLNNLSQLGIQTPKARQDYMSENNLMDSDLPLSIIKSSTAIAKKLGPSNQRSFYENIEDEEKVINIPAMVQDNQNSVTSPKKKKCIKDSSDSEISYYESLGQYDSIDSEYSSGQDEPLANMTAHVITRSSPSQISSRRPPRSRNAAKQKLSRSERERARLESNHPEMKNMWEDLEHLPKIGENASFDQPKNITRELKPFQLQGVAWMKAMEETQWAGGLLGDEMGMGKTIQAVTLIMSDWPAKKPSLVLMPPVALLQWQQEIDAYTNGALKTFVYHGTNTKSKGISKQDIIKFDVILMSYNSLESMYRKQEKGFKRKDGILKEKSVIHQTRFHRVILDEAHCIKSRSTGSARACFALQADHKWCLSGTPLQNRIGELFSLLRFLDIRPFICYFCKQCSCSALNWDMNEMNRCRSCKHNGMQHISLFNFEILNPIQKHGDGGPGAEAFKKLRLLTDRFMLRRLKCDHTSAMELPVKEIYVDRQFFGEEENDFAASIMNNGTRKFETYVAQGVVLNNYANIFGLILHMRQVADHPDLILKKNCEGGQNILFCCICDETAEDAIRSACRHDFCRECAKNYVKTFANPDCPQCHIQLSIDLEQPEIEQEETTVKKSSIINRIKMENWTSSTKIEALVHDLYKLRSKNMSHKSIIFSQFTTMLQLVEWRLRRAGITTVMLDGSMTPSQRQASINHFMTNVNVECFLVSLKAGGVALNLTEASRVFIVDPWWNPAAEWQSADRCHRIGQARPCTVTRLCIEDSVESRMVLLQEKKANMINSTINADQSAMESLTPEDMQFLFRGN